MKKLSAVVAIFALLGSAYQTLACEQTSTVLKEIQVCAPVDPACADQVPYPVCPDGSPACTVDLPRACPAGELPYSVSSCQSHGYPEGVLTASFEGRVICFENVLYPITGASCQ